VCILSSGSQLDRFTKKRFYSKNSGSVEIKRIDATPETCANICIAESNCVGFQIDLSNMIYPTDIPSCTRFSVLNQKTTTMNKDLYIKNL
jgi:hypothetical protein